MKARIPSVQDITKKAVQEYIDNEWQDKLVEERLTTSRRMMKVMMLALNELYNYGVKRNQQVCARIAEIIEDELQRMCGDHGDFWYLIDYRLKQIHCDFFPTEDEMVFKKKDEK